MDGYTSPYSTRRPYGGLLSATQGFLNAYMQHQKLRQQARQTETMNQFRQSLEVGRQEDVWWKKQRRLAFEQAPTGRRMDFFVRREPTVNIFTPGQAKGFGESAARFLMGAAEGGKLSRDSALEAYKLYRAQAGAEKPDISESELKQIDAAWDAAAIYNVSPYQAEMPEIEGGWEPDKDPEIRELRPYLPTITDEYVPESEPKPLGFMTSFGLGVDKVAGGAIDTYKGLEQGIDKVFRKQPATGTAEAKMESAIAAENWDDALMWMHYGKTPIPRGIATRAQQAGHSAESIVKAIQTFPDPTKITAEMLNAALQEKPLFEKPVEKDISTLSDEELRRIAEGG